MIQIKTSIGYIDAREELVDTIIIAEDGQEYIRNIYGMWNIYVEPDLKEVKKVNIHKQNIEKPKKHKRPLSKYNIFFKEYMKYISEQHPDIIGKDRMKMIAEAWTKNKTSV